MRVIVITCLMLVLMYKPAYCEWTQQDAALECVYLAVNAADLASTWSVTDPKSGSYEVNPIIGRNPTPQRLVGVFLTTTALHYVVMRLLPDDWRKLAWNGTINIKAAMFKHNYAVDDGYSNPRWDFTMQFKF